MTDANSYDWSQNSVWHISSVSFSARFPCLGKEIKYFLKIIFSDEWRIKNIFKLVIYPLPVSTQTSLSPSLILCLFWNTSYLASRIFPKFPINCTAWLFSDCFITLQPLNLCLPNRLLHRSINFSSHKLCYSSFSEGGGGKLCVSAFKGIICISFSFVLGFYF